MNKRGQFFILAAVIFSGLLLSVSLSANRITSTRETSSFYKSSELIDREINSVRSYQVYSGMSSDKVDGFAKNLSANLLDYDQNLNFILIYGNSSYLKIKNFGSQTINITNSSSEISLEGENSQYQSKIKIDIGLTTLLNTSPGDKEITLINYGEGTLNVTFQDYVYEFNITSDNQVIYILQKEMEGANYVEVR